MTTSDVSNMIRFIQRLTNLIIGAIIFLQIIINHEKLSDYFMPVKLYNLRKINLDMFGYDSNLAYIETNFLNRKIIETEYPQLNGQYFSPFLENSTKETFTQSENSKKVVCWYEGLCYEYFEPAIEKHPDVSVRRNQCENMLRSGKWNKSPYPVFFRGAVSWNGNTSFQWDTQGCVQRIYYWREARRCLKKQMMFFLGGHRSRQMFLAARAMVNDTLVFEDPGSKDSHPDLSYQYNVQVGVDDSISQMFVDLQHKYLEEKSVGSASNVAPMIIQARSPRKIIVINPNEDYPSKDHFKHLTALIKMLSSDKFVKFILIFSLETGPDMDRKTVSKFNDQLEKFVSSLGLEYVKFIKQGY